MRLGDKPLIPRQGGFTYVAVLFALAIFGIGLAALGETWSARSHRDKEEDLIRVGSAYASAISQYYRRSPGSAKQYPVKLEDLLEDRRFVGTERYLRQLYPDPMAGGQEWGIVKAPDGGVAGVFSLSEKNSLRQSPLVLSSGATIAGSRYLEWKFIFQPPKP